MFRWRRLRHGAHQVNKLSLSGSSVAPDVDQAAAEDALEEVPLLRALADRVPLALLRVNVAIRASDVQIAADHQRATGLAGQRRVLLHLPQKAELRLVVFPAVRHVDGCDGQVAGRRLDDSRFVVERRMSKHRLLREATLPEVQADAGVRRGSVPVTPVVGETAQRFRHLLALRLELLEADDIGTLARNRAPPARPRAPGSR